MKRYLYNLLHADVGKPALLVTVPLVVFLVIKHGHAQQQRLERARLVHSLGNLKRIGRALSQYAGDHHGALPAMQSAEAAREALRPHLKRDDVWARPTGSRGRSPEHGGYLPNAFLSQRDFSSLPAGTVLFHEAGPYNQGGRAVLWVSGKAHGCSVKWLHEKAWQRAKQVSSIL